MEVVNGLLISSWSFFVAKKPAPLSRISPGDWGLLLHQIDDRLPAAMDFAGAKFESLQRGIGDRLKKGKVWS